MGSASGGLAVVIPARLASTRLPKKLLRKIAGRSVLEWTWSRIPRVANLAGVWIATDSDEIAGEATRFGADVLRTGPQPSGTDRVGAAIAGLTPRPRWVVNLQGDEPLVDPETISALCAALGSGDDQLVTCAAPIRDVREWCDPSVVKVVCDADGCALYFSRAPIPGAPGATADARFARARDLARVHVGIYGYPVPLLERLLALPPSPLERIESLEQLRALEAGIPMRVVQVGPQGPSVDTAEDLRRVESILHAAGDATARPARGRGAQS